MHEMALAEAVLTAASEVAMREGLKSVSKIEVRLGELQRIRTETFETCLTAVRTEAEPTVAASEVVVSIEPAGFSCRPCGHPFGLRDTKALSDDPAEAVHFIPELAHAFLRCPSCGSADFEITSGRGVSIASIEGED